MPNFLPHHAALLPAFRDEACFTLDYARDRILHAALQLADEQLWSRPRPAMNALGNILLHVRGNLTQWIIVGCDPTGTKRDERDRPAEFARRDVVPGTRLVGDLRATVDEAKATIAALDERELLRPRVIQGFTVTAIGAVWHSVAHLEGHAQESIYAARLILGDRYRFKDAY